VIDSDGDGVADTIGWAVDADRDGQADWVDANHDGVLDGIGIDTDGDYKVDALRFDSNGDGIIDDTDNDVDHVGDSVRPTHSGGASSGSASGGAAGGTGGGGTLGSGGSLPGSGGSLSQGSGGALGSGTGGLQLAPGCTDADLLCADFEDAVVGQKPAGTPWMAENCFDPGYTKTVESGVGVSGSQGLVTSGASSSANTCALVYDLGAQTDFWLRAWIKIGGADPDLQHEVTFLELGASATVDDPELRIGYRGDSSCSNSGANYQGFELGATKGLNNGEDTGCTGSKVNLGMPVASEWYCLEVHVTQGGGQLMSDLFVDGVNQDYLIHSSPQTEVGGAFQAQYLKVGMQSYSGTFDSLTLDDISLSTTRIACPSK